MEIAGIELDTLEINNIGSWPPLIKRITISGTCILLLVCGYLLKISDSLSELTTLISQKETLLVTFVENQKTVAHLDSYKKDVKLVREQFEKLTEQLPQHNEEAGLLEDMSQQAASNTLQFVKIKPETPEDKGFYKVNPMELTLSGDYNGFGEFVSNIANMPRIITLHDFEIKRNTSEGKGPLLIVLKARIYWATLAKGYTQ